MKTNRMSLDDFKKKVSTSNETLAYAKGGQVRNNMCTGDAFRPQEKCHPKPN